MAVIAPPPTTMHGRLAVSRSLIAASMACASARGFPIGRRLVEFRDVDVSSLHLDVKRQLHVHRARAARQHRIPGAMHHEGNLIGADHIEGALGNRRRNVRKIGRGEAVEFLHHAVSAHVRGGAASNKEKRRRVAVSGREPNDRVRRARPDRCASSDGLAGNPVVRIGDVNGVLLVHHLNEGKLRDRIVEGVDHAPIAVPGQAGDIRNSVCLESLSDQLSHCELHRQPPRLDLYASPHILLSDRARSEPIRRACVPGVTANMSRGCIILLTLWSEDEHESTHVSFQSWQLFAVAGFAPSMFGENPMPEYNQRRSLSFSNDWIESLLVNAVREMPVEDAIVVNLSTTDLRYRVGADHGTILPWKSSMLRHCTIESAETAALLHVRQRTNLGGVALGWEWYGQRNPAVSSRHSAVHLNPG